MTVLFYWNERDEMNGLLLTIWGITGLIVGAVVISIETAHSSDSSLMRSLSFADKVFVSLVGAGWMLSGVRFGISAKTCIVSLFILFAVRIAKTDILENKITNKSLLSLSFVGMTVMLTRLSGISITSQALGFFVGGTLFLIPFALGKGIGAGDVKYLFLIGFLLGYPDIVYALMSLFLSLMLWTIWKALRQEKILKTKIALAPFISLGFVTALLVSNRS
jgi:leader peptidase (prepilin peptidase) / N-methyltransferase